MSADAWVPVPVDPYGQMYEINTATGDVRSVDRTVVDALRRPRRLRGRVLVQVPDVRGHPQVSLSHRGQRRTMRVATLLRQASRGAGSW